MGPLSWMVDVIVLIILLYSLFLGFQRGLWAFMVDFLVLGTSLGLFWIYYQKTGNFLFGVLIFIFIFLFLTIIRYFLTKLLKAKDQQRPRSIINQFGGLALGFIRGMFIIIILCLLIEIIPLNTTFEYNFKQAVRTSRSYKTIQRFIPLDKLAFLENIRFISELISNRQIAEGLKDQMEFMDLFKNKNFKEMIGDIDSSY